MSELNYYKITGLSDTVQYGKGGGNIKFVSTDTRFVFTEEDSSIVTDVEARTVIARNTLSIPNSTGTIDINGAKLGYSDNSLAFLGSGAVILPVGGNSSRPLSPVVGMLRVNTESSVRLESWSGATWQNISSIAGSTGEVQFNFNGSLGASSRFKISFSEVNNSTTLKLGDPESFSGQSSVAYIDGESSPSAKQGTTLQIRGGDNSGTGSAGSVNISGGYAIGAGTYAGNVVLTGGESSVGNHGHILTYTLNSSGLPEERLRIAGITGAWGLNGLNYGSPGQVLTSQGANSPPIWTSVDGVAKQQFSYDLNPTVNIVIVPLNSIILSVTITITSPFNDSTTTLRVGDAVVTDRLFAISDNLPMIEGSYTVYPNYQYGSTTLLTLTMTGNSTAGSGVVTIQFE